MEGYVSLLTQDKQGVDLHVPYLGFYGDWENLPMVEDLSDGIYNVAPTLLMNANDQNRAYYLGYNAVSEAFRFDKRAFSFHNLWTYFAENFQSLSASQL